MIFRYGTMNSGKSTMLLQTVHSHESKGMRVIVMKPRLDTKDEDRISSRLGISRKVDILIRESDNLYTALNRYLEVQMVDIVVVDEAQFLTRDQVDQLSDLSIDRPVICYGLRTDFKTQGFPGSSRLLELATDLEEITNGVCKCGDKPLFNMRLVNGVPTNEGESVVIDGEVGAISYESVCKRCFPFNIKEGWNE